MLPADASSAGAVADRGSVPRGPWLRLDVDPRLVLGAFTVGSVVLAAIAAARPSLALGTVADRVLNSDAEGSLSAWFTSFELAVLALLLASVALATAGRQRLVWWVLAGTAMVMSMDETVALHEVAAARFARLVGADGSLAEIWVLPAAAGALVAVVALVPLLRSLGRATALAVLLGAAMYLGGALGMELVGSLLGGAGAPGYTAAAVTEELLEGLGVAVVAAAVAHHLRAQALPSATAAA